MKKQEIIAAIAGSVLAASIFTGCVIGHAKFEGEALASSPQARGASNRRKPILRPPVFVFQISN